MALTLSLVAIASVAVAADAVVSAPPAAAAATTGELTYQDCITGSTAAGPAGSGACEAIASAALAGKDSGLDLPEQVAVSPDGESLYVVSTDDDAIATFDRDPDTGALTYVSCITGENESGPAGTGACAAIASARIGGQNSGLDHTRAVTVSPDGASVYVAAFDDDAIATFQRAPATGALTYAGCITGEPVSGPSGSGACALTPSARNASAFGSVSGLDGPVAIILSPDGASVYVVARGDHAIARFARNTTTAALAFDHCITGSTTVASLAGCERLPFASNLATDSGMQTPVSAAVSPDGASLYVTAHKDDSVVRFDLDSTSGRPVYRGCITGRAEVGPAGNGACAAIPSASPDGVNSGLDAPEVNGAQSVAVSPDDTSVYITSLGDHAVARFDRDPATGELAYAGCITGETESGPAGSGACQAIGAARSGGSLSGLGNPQAMTVSPDDASVYVLSSENTIARFDRDTATGALSYAGCLTSSSTMVSLAGCTATSTVTGSAAGSGFGRPQSVAFSADGASLYTASALDDAVAAFTRVAAVNGPPDAVDDAATVNEGSGATPVDVLGNDTDPDGDPLRITGNTTAVNGTATCDADDCTYTPDPGFTGEDAFTYTITDGNGGVDSANVTLTVTGSASLTVAVPAPPDGPDSVPLSIQANPPDGVTLICLDDEEPDTPATVECGVGPFSAPADVEVTFEAPQGWRVDALDCGTHGTFTISPATITVQPGDHAHCTLQLTKLPAFVTLALDTSPDDPRDFDLSVQPLPSGTAQFVTVDDDPGSPEPAEGTFGPFLAPVDVAVRFVGALPPDLRFDGIDCGAHGTFTSTSASITLQPGDHPRCTFRLTLVVASVTVALDASPDAAEDFVLSVQPLPSGTAEFVTVDDDPGSPEPADGTFGPFPAPVDLALRFVTLVPPGMRFDGIDCGAHGVFAGTSATITLQPDDHPRCTFLLTTDTTAPVSTLRSPQFISTRLRQPLSGSVTDDRSGVAGVTVTYTNTLTGAVATVEAVLQCDAPRRSCTFSAAGPGRPGLWAANARARDAVGNVESPGSTARVVARGAAGGLLARHPS